MKKWAKILLGVGVVWLVLVAVFLIYYCEFAAVLLKCVSAEGCSMVKRGVGCSAINYVVDILILGIPSWILFLVVFLKGRK